MKKNILVYGVIILAALGLAAAGYWYWQSQQNGVGGGLQTVALDNPGIASFDDVCTKGENSELNCTGNIKQLGCDRYRSASDTFTDLNPFYPILICKKDGSLTDEGIYRQSKNGATLARETIEYIIIRDGTFQLIKTEDELREVFQSIESIAEAKSYFSLLHKGVLVLDEETLSHIKSPRSFRGERKGGRFAVSIDSLALNQVTETADGYAITAYSNIPDFCTDEVYLQTFLLKRNGRLIEQNKELIWEMINKPSCID